MLAQVIMKGIINEFVVTASNISPYVGSENISVQVVIKRGILNRQSRAERQNTFDWMHILPVRVTISQYQSYSANGSHILSILVIFYQPE